MLSQNLQVSFLRTFKVLKMSQKSETFFDTVFVSLFFCFIQCLRYLMHINEVLLYYELLLSVSSPSCIPFLSSFVPRQYTREHSCSSVFMVVCLLSHFWPYFLSVFSGIFGFMSVFRLSVWLLLLLSTFCLFSVFCWSYFFMVSVRFLPFLSDSCLISVWFLSDFWLISVWYLPNSCLISVCPTLSYPCLITVIVLSD